MKWTLPVLALAAILWAPQGASAVEIKNIRPCYGPPLGATRTNLKLVGGDVLFITYDIEGLKLDDKTGRVGYQTSLEVLDPQQKSVTKSDTTNEAIPHLGGNCMPGDITIQTVPSQPTGKYTIRLTITDQNAKDKATKDINFELIPAEFALVGIVAPSAGFPGQNYVTQFGVVNLKLDAKDSPNAEVTMKVSDDKGKAVMTPVKQIFPKDLPPGIKDLKK